MIKCLKCERLFPNKDSTNAHQRVHSTKPRTGEDIELTKKRNFKKGLDFYQNYLKNPKLCLFCQKPIFIRINPDGYNANQLCILRQKKFCNSSCAASYNNRHKTKGCRRSKLENWLENQLSILYPNLKIIYNDRTTLGLELDIYIPELKLAFELNGIFHFEPIYGIKKLDKIQYNDKQKYQACISKNINLCVIDTMSLKYFKENKCQKFLDIITDIINKMAPALRTARS